MAEKESPLVAWLSFAAAVVSAAFGLYVNEKSNDNAALIGGLQRQLEEKKHDLERFKFVETLTDKLTKDASDREALISLALADFALEDAEYQKLLNALNRTGDERLQELTNTVGQQSEREELLKESAPSSAPAPSLPSPALSVVAPPVEINTPRPHAGGVGASGKEGTTTTSRTSGLLADLIGPDRETRINAYRLLLTVPPQEAEASVLTFLGELNTQPSPYTLTNAGLNNLLLYIGTRMACWKDVASVQAEAATLQKKTPPEIIRHLAQVGFGKIAAFKPTKNAPQNNACN